MVALYDFLQAILDTDDCIKAARIVTLNDAFPRHILNINTECIHFLDSYWDGVVNGLYYKTCPDGYFTCESSHPYSHLFSLTLQFNTTLAHQLDAIAAIEKYISLHASLLPTIHLYSCPVYFVRNDYTYTTHTLFDAVIVQCRVRDGWAVINNTAPYILFSQQIMHRIERGLVSVTSCSKPIPLEIDGIVSRYLDSFNTLDDIKLVIRGARVDRIDFSVSFQVDVQGITDGFKDGYFYKRYNDGIVFVFVDACTVWVYEACYPTLDSCAFLFGDDEERHGLTFGAGIVGELKKRWWMGVGENVWNGGSGDLEGVWEWCEDKVYSIQVGLLMYLASVLNEYVVSNLGTLGRL